MLLECPGYSYQALVTNLPASVPPIEVWRDYNGRAGIENVIKELDYGFGLPKLCCKNFWATEAALSLAVLTYNFSVLFARHLGWLDKVTIGTLRYPALCHRRNPQPRAGRTLSSSVCRWKIDRGGEPFGRSSSPHSPTAMQLPNAHEKPER
jgi:hypothetical protein